MKMVTYFNKKDLVEFGNFLFSEERERSFIHTSAQAMTEGIEFNSSWERLRTVTHADVENWMDSKRKPIRKAAPKIEAPKWLVDYMATAPKELQNYVFTVFNDRDEWGRETINSFSWMDTVEESQFWICVHNKSWEEALFELRKNNLL